MILFCLPIDKSCFETLFNHRDMLEITRQLPVCHVEAPGQHEEAKTLPNASVDVTTLYSGLTLIVFILTCNAVIILFFICLIVTCRLMVILTSDLSAIPTLQWTSCLRHYLLSSDTLGKTVLKHLRSLTVNVILLLIWYTFAFWLRTFQVE